MTFETAMEILRDFALSWDEQKQIIAIARGRLQRQSSQFFGDQQPK